MNRFSIKLLLSTTFLVSTVLPPKNLFAMDEASSSAPVGDSFDRPTTISFVRPEDGALSSMPKKSLSLTELRKGILDKKIPLEDRIKMASPARILKEVSDEITGTVSLPKEALSELIKKSI